MKKVLLSTSALALVGAIASPASANEWDVDVGGFTEWWLGYSDVDVDSSNNFNGVTIDGAEGGYDGIEPLGGDAEIVVVPTLTLDNGIQFGANIQLEALNPGGVDESYIFAEGAFGQVLLGNENSAGYLRQLVAPDVTAVGVNSGSTTAYAPISGFATGFTDGSATVNVQTGNDIFRGTLGTTALENMRNSDIARITYFTPRFAGFQAGASYARDNSNQDNLFSAKANNEVAGSVNDIWDVTASYANSFGAFDVGLSGRYGWANIEDGHGDDDDDDDNDFFGGADDPKVWGVGANLGYAGFTVGGSYAEQNDGGNMEGEAWDAGVAYETGPWGFSVTYFNGENVDNENFNRFVGVTDDGDPIFETEDEQLKQWIGGVSYVVADGVVLGVHGGHIDFDEELDDDGTDGGNDVKAWFVGTSASLAF